jgi:hypothetical protein
LGSEIFIKICFWSNDWRFQYSVRRCIFALQINLKTRRIHKKDPQTIGWKINRQAAKAAVDWLIPLKLTVQMQSQKWKREVVRFSGTNYLLGER